MPLSERYLAWEAAARRADTAAEQIGRLLRTGQDVPAAMREDLERLDADAQLKVALLMTSPPQVSPEPAP